MNKTSKVILGVSIGCVLLSIGSITNLGIVGVYPEKTGYFIKEDMNTFLNDGVIHSRRTVGFPFSSVVKDYDDGLLKTTLEETTFIDHGAEDYEYYSWGVNHYSINTDHLKMDITETGMTVYIYKNKSRYVTANTTIEHKYTCSFEEGSELIRVIREGVYRKILDEHQMPQYSSSSSYNEESSL